ncbi:MAG: major capsid protein [Microvirus sp.]|nr:MAG: major capsid protein [Microvirus sp.]
MNSQHPRHVVPGDGSEHAFSRVPQADIQRSAFDLSHTHKTTIDPGYLYPLFWQDVIPGDTHTVTPTLVAQLLTLKQQLMDSLFVDLHYWFVQARFLWEHFEEFQGSNPNPISDPTPTVYTIPALNMNITGGIPEGHLFDYFGYPTKVQTTIPHTALLGRAYQLVYNLNYRDENLIDTVPMSLGDGPDALSAFTLLKRGKRKDYFTSLLPWPQKGPDVSLPLGGTAPVYVTDTGNPWLAKQVVDNQVSPGFAPNYPLQVGATTAGQMTSDAGAAKPLFFDPADTLHADLSAATAVTINALRLAVTYQQQLERDARGGTRYTEAIKSRFGVTSPDARLNRPEYLGGGTIPVMVHSVVNTNQASGSVLGNRAAFGHAQSSGGLGFTHSFTEHGYIIGLVSVRSDYTYQQGSNRHLLKQTRNDLYEPVFANLGEQAVTRAEICLSGGATDLETLGYQERWAEYRSRPSYLSGKMRSNATGSLDVWHLAQEFTAPVLLEQDFIEENPPLDRVVNVPSEPIFNVDMFTHVRSVRPLPIFSAPGLRVL